MPMKAHVDTESIFRIPTLPTVIDSSEYIWLGSGALVPSGGAVVPRLVQPGETASGCPRTVPTTHPDTCKKMELGSSQQVNWNKKGSDWL